MLRPIFYSLNHFFQLDLLSPTSSNKINNFPFGSNNVFLFIFPIHLIFETGMIPFLEFLYPHDKNLSEVFTSNDILD